MITFSNFHGHNQFSHFDGMGNSRTAAKRAAEIGYKALGLTNHGTVAGLLEHYTECNEAGVKPALGCEVYFTDKFEDKKQKSYSHLTLLAYNFEGYQNLMEMLSYANKNQYYYKACVDFDLLEKYSDGLICFSGCLACLSSKKLFGEVDKDGNVVKLPSESKALENIKRLYDIFGDKFFLEVMPAFGIDKQVIYNNFIINTVAKNIKRPVVLTLDAHFVSHCDYDTYCVMRKMGETHKYLRDDSEFRYLMEPKEIISHWRKDMPGIDPSEFIDNTNQVSDLIDIKIDFGKSMPEIDWGMPSQELLVDIAVRRLKEEDKWNDEYRGRLKFELETILKKGFADYFLLCRKIINKAKENGIGTNFGRGSVCGSLLAYAIGITRVDPLIFDTPFERFLRPNKNVLPDIDMDFDSSRKDDMVQSVLDEFDGRSAKFSTIGRYKAKNLINDLFKYLEVPIDEQKSIKDVLLEELEKLGKEAIFEKLIENDVLSDADKNHKNIIKHFCKLYKQAKFVGTHAAGILITDGPVERYDAIARSKGGFQTSHDMDQLQDHGLLKLDILGLANISVTQEIEAQTGASYSSEILNDAEVYKQFAKGATIGVFQFDKSCAIKVLKKVKPRNFEELCACNALNRPGPKLRINEDELSTLEKYVAIRNGKMEEEKNTPWYPYCKDTYGLLLYQEQMMWICREVAGLDWDTTDQIVKQLSKKVEEKRQKLKKPFIDGCVKNGVNAKEAEDFYEKNTLYGFNKSHCVAYTLFSVYQMHLKIKYPLEWWCYLIKNENDETKREIYTSCAARFGVIFLLPHINGDKHYQIIEPGEPIGIESLDKEGVVEDGQMFIREGLSSVKGVGEAACDFILQNRPYKTKQDWLDTCEIRVEKENKNGKMTKRKPINKRTIEALANCGACLLDENEADIYLEKCFQYNSEIRSRYKYYS